MNSLEEQIADFISKSGSNSAWDRSQFDMLFPELVLHQRRENPIYRSYLMSFNDPVVTDYLDVKPVPVTFFKEFELRSYQERSTELCWESSGTSGVKSKTYLKDAHLYNLVIDKLWRERVRPLNGVTYRLIPLAHEWSNSSLAHFFTIGNMCEESNWESAYSFDGESATFSIQFSRLIDLFEHHEDIKLPVRLCGTSYAVALLFDHMEKLNVRFSLPRGSSIIDTGGYKGFVRERSREEFLEQAAYYLDINRYNCLNEYGMSELSSHFWSTYIHESDDHLFYSEWWEVPPWVRVRSVDAFTLEDRQGGVGVFYDLANVWSCCAIQTQDLIEVRNYNEKQYIRPLGRVKEAELKGCSITSELSHR